MHHICTPPPALKLLHPPHALRSPPNLPRALPQVARDIVEEIRAALAHKREKLILESGASSSGFKDPFGPSNPFAAGNGRNDDMHRPFNTRR